MYGAALRVRPGLKRGWSWLGAGIEQRDHFRQAGGSKLATHKGGLDNSLL